MAQKTFEQSMKQLEQIVQELEDGDLPLEKAIKKFEEGIKLTKLCSEKLDETEKKISILLKNAEGQMIEKPFNAEDETDDDQGIMFDLNVYLAEKIERINAAIEYILKTKKSFLGPFFWDGTFFLGMVTRV